LKLVIVAILDYPGTTAVKTGFDHQSHDVNACKWRFSGVLEHDAAAHEKYLEI